MAGLFGSMDIVWIGSQRISTGRRSPRPTLAAKAEPGIGWFALWRCMRPRIHTSGKCFQYATGQMENMGFSDFDLADSQGHFCQYDCLDWPLAHPA